MLVIAGKPIHKSWRVKNWVTKRRNELDDDGKLGGKTKAVEWALRRKRKEVKLHKIIKSKVFSLIFHSTNKNYDFD